MKRLIFIFIFSLLVYFYGKSERIITSFDIAGWYLSSDLVLICEVNRIDTVKISRSKNI
jgi:hypothetical protein